MGRKTNPIVLRVGNITKDWGGKWFSDRRAVFRKNLLSDLAIRRYFDKKHRLSSISKIDIERGQQETVLTIHTSRPALIIGRGGSGIEEIQKDLKKKAKIKSKMRVNVQEIRNPDTDAGAVATQVVEQLERRFAFRRVLKQSVFRVMQAGAKGVKVLVTGRLNGADIARTEWLAEGNVPLHTFRADISYAQRHAFTTYGTLGVKVWINRGILEQGEEDKPVTPKEREKKEKTERRESLAKKAEKSVRVKTKNNQTK